MPLNIDEVRQIAALARLRIGEEEVERWTLQLAQIVDHVVGLPATEETSAGPEQARSLPERDDTVARRAVGATLLENAPERHLDYVVVPRVIGG